MGGETLMTRFKGRESTVDGLSRDATATIPADVAVSYTLFPPSNIFPSK